MADKQASAEFENMLKKRETSKACRTKVHKDKNWTFKTCLKVVGTCLPNAGDTNKNVLIDA